MMNQEFEVKTLLDMKARGIRAWPPFNIGTLLHIFSMLPDFKQTIVDVGGTKTESTKLSKLKNWQNDYIPDRMFYSGNDVNREKHINSFAVTLASALRKHNYCCNGDREILEHLLCDVVHDIMLNDRPRPSNKDSRIGLKGTEKNQVQNLVEAPFVFGIDYDGFFQSQLYETFLGLIKIAVKCRNVVEDEEVRESYEDWTVYYAKRVKQIYKYHMDAKAKDPSTSFFFPKKPSNSDPITPTAEQIQKAKTIANAIFVQGDQRRNLTENCFRQAKLLPLSDWVNKQKKAAERDDIRWRWFPLPQSQECIPIPYNEVISYDTPAVTRGQFKIDVDEEFICIPDDLKILHDNREIMHLAQRRDSINVYKYKPISARKIHIASLLKSEIDSQDVTDYKWHMTIKPIDYFEQITMRSFFQNRLKDLDVYEDADIALRKKYDETLFVNQMGFSNAPAHFFAGCGVWILSKDGYLMVSFRGKLFEKPGRLGYSSAGSCEYSDRLALRGKEGATKEIAGLELEADPFKTAKRETKEECNIEIPLEELELVSFGIDFDRYLQQFSFFYRSALDADTIISLSQRAISTNEQVLFALPFNNEAITVMLTNYELEPGAIASLLNIAKKYLKDDIDS